MNNPSPFNPQPSVPEQNHQSRARVRTAVTLVFAVNFIALLALLIIGFGCRKPAETETTSTDTAALSPPSFDSNAVAPPTLTDTNAPVAATPYVPPAPEPTPAPTPPAPATQEHVIVKGDLVVNLAKSYHVSVKAIEDANPGLDPNRLKIGQSIHIPAAAVDATPSPSSAPADAKTSDQIYKVVSGDSLTSIGKHFGVSVKALRSANSLTSDRIKVGDKLKIPAKAAAPSAAPASTEPAEPSSGAPPATASPKPS